MELALWNTNIGKVTIRPYNERDTHLALGADLVRQHRIDHVLFEMDLERSIAARKRWFHIDN